MRTKKIEPEFIIRDGVPVSVVIDINHYEEMLERLEELDDLEALRKIRSKPIKMRKLSEYLREKKNV